MPVRCGDYFLFFSFVAMVVVVVQGAILIGNSCHLFQYAVLAWEPLCCEVSQARSLDYVLFFSIVATVMVTV